MVVRTVSGDRPQHPLAHMRVRTGYEPCPTGYHNTEFPGRTSQAKLKYPTACTRPRAGNKPGRGIIGTSLVKARAWAVVGQAGQSCSTHRHMWAKSRSRPYWARLQHPLVILRTRMGVGQGGLGHASAGEFQDWLLAMSIWVAAPTGTHEIHF